MKILLLEDDPLLHECFKEYLESEKFEVFSAFSAYDVYDLTYQERFDLYLFDVNLSIGESGFEILKALRESGDMTPAIYITAQVDIDSISKGFDMGADDYIKKPFEPKELIIRIKNRYKKESFIYYQDFKYDLNNRHLYKDSQMIHLSSILAEIFHILILNRGKLVSIDTLLEILIVPNPNALRVNLSKLKKILDIDIKNIKGRGYLIE